MDMVKGLIISMEGNGSFSFGVWIIYLLNIIFKVCFDWIF